MRLRARVTRLRDELDRERAHAGEADRHCAALVEEHLALKDKLAAHERAGIISREEHRKIVKAAIQKATDKLRGRLRRQRDRLLRAHVVFDRGEGG